jgi:adenine deaminase
MRHLLTVPGNPKDRGQGDGSVGQPIEGNIVDVVEGKIFPGRIFHENGVITRVAPVPGSYTGFLLPGFLDAHIHIDSSLLCPSRFAEAVVPHGTTAVITDPHEIANVMGLAGISWMRRDAALVPLRVFFTAPSCVPATAFETSGASLGIADVEALLREPDVVALGEVMDYPAAIARNEEVMAKIGAANHAGKPIDGHCPLVTGEDLRRYASLGISTDHECTNVSEALEKHALGMRILVRDGTAAKNLPALAPFARKHDFILVSDDKLAPDLIESHINGSLARAVSLGIDPLHAVRAVTLRPALHYRLPLGAIAEGRMADIVKVRDLSGFFAEEVYIDGTQAAKEGRASFTAKPLSVSTTIPVSPKIPHDFAVSAPGPSVTARVIGLNRDEIVTRNETATLKAEGGRVIPDRKRDILLISVVNRYRNSPVATGFVTGFGLKRGAMASSVAHDAHNIISVGADPEDMARAVNTLIRESGGLCYAAGETSALLPLPIAGLMSTEPPVDVRTRLSHLHAKTEEAGCALDSPYMTLSFLSLLVIPHLKIGDRGMFDARAFRFVDPILAAAPDPPAGNRS